MEADFPESKNSRLWNAKERSYLQVRAAASDLWVRHVSERSASPGTTFTVTSGLGAKWHILALRRSRRLKCASILHKLFASMAPLGRRALVNYFVKFILSLTLTEPKAPDREVTPRNH